MMIKYFCHYKGASTLQGGGGSTGSPSHEYYFLIDQVLSTWSDSLDSGGSPRPAPV